MNGMVPFFYRKRTCDTNLTSNTPANQYQRQKIIQNTVRVPSSVYIMNLGALTAYKYPYTPDKVCWNQMSDRPVPSKQVATIPTGYANSMNGKHHSVTSSKPGSQTPGGIGCDIKHNSYERFLNRLKGKSALRRGPIPVTYGTPFIPFNPAFPVYGGKTIKTAIINGCDCPILDTDETDIYNNPLYQPDPNTNYGFSVGTYVYAMQSGNDYYTRAIVTDIDGDLYTIMFDNGTVETQNVNQLLIYFPCNCNATINGYSYPTGFLQTVREKFANYCL